MTPLCSTGKTFLLSSNCLIVPDVMLYSCAVYVCFDWWHWSEDSNAQYRMLRWSCYQSRGSREKIFHLHPTAHSIQVPSSGGAYRCWTSLGSQNRWCSRYLVSPSLILEYHYMHFAYILQKHSTYSHSETLWDQKIEAIGLDSCGLPP